MIPVYLITGFLGSGKTTFLKELLKDDSRNVLVIQNEFAPTGIDGKELKGESDDFELIEINNGSVFCSCLMGSFINTLKKATLKFQPDIIYLEASGLADPSTINQILDEKELHKMVYLEGSVCVIDTLNYHRALKRMPRVIQQVQIADFIIINKIDLVDASIVLEVEKELGKLNPLAEKVPTSYCHLDKLPVLNDSSAKKAYNDQEGEGRPDLQSSVLKSVKKVKSDTFELLINELHEISIRAKGFINLDNGKTVLFQSVYDKLTSSEYPNYIGNTEFMAIGEEVSLIVLNTIFKKYIA